MHCINFLKLFGYPIEHQLYLEEALLRTNDENWFIINENIPLPAIVMGFASKPAEWVDCFRLREYPVSMIKRFSGGGTVVVDKDTIFSTFILNDDVVGENCLLKDIVGKIYFEIYMPAFRPMNLDIVENDYVMCGKKCGGNAFYIKKLRSLQHTSFLWDFSLEKMRYLKVPKKQPKYRENKSHEDFLCKLSDFFPSRHRVIHSIIKRVKKIFYVKEVSLEQYIYVLDIPHRRLTKRC